MIHRTIHKKLRYELQQENHEIVRYYLKLWLPVMPVVLLIAGMLWVRFYHAPYQNSIWQAAALGVDVSTLVDANRFYDQSAQSHILYAQDLAHAQKLMTSSSPVIRARAMLIFTNCTDPSIKSKAIATVRSAAGDQEPAVRYKVIAGLRQLKDPDVRSVAQQLENDPVDYVREEAKAALNENNAIH